MMLEKNEDGRWGIDSEGVSLLERRVLSDQMGVCRHLDLIAHSFLLS